MSLNDDMVVQRNLQLQEKSPTLQQFDADQTADIETNRQVAANEMQNSDWFNGPVDTSIKAEDKEVELTTSDDHLPYLADVQNDFDLVQQYTDDKAEGNPRQPGEYSNKYAKPNTRTVQGIDLATGERHLNTADYSVDGVEHHVTRGVDLLRESTNSAVDGPSEDGIRGMSHVARSIQLQGGDFNSYKNALDKVQVSDKAMLLGWNAAARAQGQQEIEQAFTSPVSQADVEELPREPLPDLNTEDLINEPEWVESSRFLWGIENAAEFEGDDQELVDWALNEMSNFNWRIVGAPSVNGSSMAYYATQAAVQGQDYAKALLTLIETYDRVNTDLGIVGRSLGAIATDPTTIAGLGAGKIGAQIAARVAKNRLQKFLVQASTIGAVEGAAFAGGENAARQSVQVDAGARESISGGEVAANAGLGAGVGAALGPVVGSVLSPWAMKQYRKGGRRLLDNARAGGGRSHMSSQTGSIGDLEGFVPFAGKTARVGTAMPKGKVKGVTTFGHGDPADMIISMDKILANPAVAKKQAVQIRAYDNFKPSRDDLSDAEVITEFKDHIKSNLLYLHDKMDPKLRVQAKEWYHGARAQVDKWMPKYGMEEQQIAAVVANLSPQKDWYQNMSLAERALDVWTEQQDTVADAAMHKAFEVVYKTDAAGNPKKSLTANDKLALKMWKEYGKGKSLREIEAETPHDIRDVISAMFVRAYDEVNNPRHHRVIAPSGDMLDYATSKVSGNRIGTGWNSYSEIAKAVAAMRDPDLQKISERLGTAHKVRNFYNNIVSPDSQLGEVTIDTHAVAAGLIKPLAGGSHEVSHNFGSAPKKGAPDTPPGIKRAGPGGSGAEGISGTYGIYATAYREAAAERGLLPREMQSITWEEIRTIFTPDYKDDFANQEAVNVVWREYKNGTISVDEARTKIEELSDVAEGRKPAWADRPDTSNAEAGPTSTYREELSGSSVPKSSGGGSGRGGATASKRSSGSGGVATQGKVGLLPSADTESVHKAAMSTPNASENKDLNNFFAKKAGFKDADEANAFYRAQSDDYDDLTSDPDRLKYLLTSEDSLADFNMSDADIPKVIANAVADKKGLRILRDKKERNALVKKISSMDKAGLVDAIDEAFDLGSASERMKRRWNQGDK